LNIVDSFGKIQIRRNLKKILKVRGKMYYHIVKQEGLKYKNLDLKEVEEAGIKIKACSHITGGGFYENVPRMLKEGTHAVIRKDSYEVPAIFKMLAKEGNVDEQVMYNTFNMGVGMMAAVDKNDVDKTISAIARAGEKAFVIGEIKEGEKGVTLV